MRHITGYILRAAFSCFLILASACNRDEVITVPTPEPEPGTGAGTGTPDDCGTPSIEWLDETGVFATKVGKETVIKPVLSNADDAEIEWRENGETIGEGPELVYIWNTTGKHYVELTVSTKAGTAYDEIRVEVSDLIPPSISLSITGDTYTVATGSVVNVVAVVSNPFNEEVAINWTVNDEPAGSTNILEYVAKKQGEFKVAITAENSDGTDTKEFVLKVIDKLSESVYFPPLSNTYSGERRYTFPHRGIFLEPVVKNVAISRYSWSVDGVAVDCTAPSFMFIPDEPGVYKVAVIVDESYIATIEVECVNIGESSRQRAVSSSSKAESWKVHEYFPAPGQFIGDTQTGGFTGTENTHSEAVKWAESRLKNKQYVSLGAWGGYIVVSFDHSIATGTGAYDFAIQGNAFFNAGTTSGGSNEPGIVYVMQDVNGNGLPDDEWYELRGSETGKGTTLNDYEVTYYRPAAPQSPVVWTDNYGSNGSIDYLIAYHRQDYYYPKWVNGDSYTLRGTIIKEKTWQDTTTGFWSNDPMEWGYADNMGGDVLDGDTNTGEGQRNGFKISNAMYPDGTPANLLYIDFIKVQTGVQSKAGWLGEVSTEVFGFTDLSIK